MSYDDPDPTRIDPVDPTAVYVPEDAGGPPYDEPPLAGGPPVPPPPDRRPWIIAGVLGAVILVLLLVLLLQDDDDEGDVVSDASTSSLVTTSTSTTVESSTTTEAEATTTTEAAVVTVPPEECAEAGEGAAKPGLAAETVYDAWVRGDQACAAELMTAPALAELFDRDGTDATDVFQGCTEEELPDPHADCAFTYEGGSTHYLMSFSDTEGWKVFDIEQVAD
jgi:hypothetical protein